jgi:hypothetical protein
LKSVAESPDRYLATAAEMLTAEGMTDAAEILRVSAVKLEKTGYDNWDGGTTIWTIYLLVEPAAFAALGVALVHGYRRGGILRDVGQMFTVAITGVCRAVQV